MCQINEKPTETVECKCKQICSKMQSSGLRCAIEGLRLNKYDRNTILSILKTTYNLLEVYSCLPGTCLLERVKYVYTKIENVDTRLVGAEGVEVQMLISELEAFVDNS